MTSSAQVSRDASAFGVDSDANTLAIGLLRQSVDPSSAHQSAIKAIDCLNQLPVPAPDAGLLVCALLATAPTTATSELVEALGRIVSNADLTRTWQPALDESFQLLSLLVTTAETSTVAKLAIDVLSVQGLHPRWARKALGLLIRAIDSRPDAVDVSKLIQVASHLDPPERLTVVRSIIIPTLLADPGTASAVLLEKLANVVGGHSELRLLMAALMTAESAPSDVREYAAAATSRAFAMAQLVRQRLSDVAPRILCIQNIADGQGDEIIRVVPLLQALLDAYPEASAVIVTDRSYLYRHDRIVTISFDEPDRIREALRSRIDVLLEFVDHEQPQLNHDPLLPHVITSVRANQRLVLDIEQGKRWNGFTFDHVTIDGMDWASALAVDRPLEPNVYDPVMRLIAELGMPLRFGEQPPSGEWLLAGRESPEVVSEWARLTEGGQDRRIALLNPFGGSARLKGFTRGTFPDLAQLIQALVDEDYDVMIAPSGEEWGTSETCHDVLRLIDDAMRQHVSVVDQGTSPAAFIQILLSFLRRADLVVTVEGWMMHAAYLAGKPYRLMTLPASDPRTWQPWGRSANQRQWIFTGAHEPNYIPLPEQPRKRAWIELLQRINDPRWGSMLQQVARSDDPDLRRAAIAAMGRCGTADARQFATWLKDPSHRVRAAAASVLLDHHRGALGVPPIPNSMCLEVIRGAGEPHPQWNDVIDMGPAALPALDALLNVEDPVTRREAAMCIEAIRRSMNDDGNETGSEKVSA